MRTRRIAFETLERRDLLAADVFEIDDTAAQANPIATNGVGQQHSISPVGDIDFVRFQVAELSRVRVETSGDERADTYLNLYGPDDANNRVAYNDDGGDGAYSLISTYLEAGAYYARVNEYNDNDEIAQYELQVEVTPLSDLADDYEDDDTAENATVLPLAGQQQEHSIHHPADEDWFTFSLTESSRIVIDTAGPAGDPEMSLYNVDGQRIEYDDSSGPGYFPQITAYLDAGDYWLMVEEDGNNAAIDAYTIQAVATSYTDLEDDYEADNAPGNATTLTLDGSTQSHSVHHPADVDWYTFELTEASRVVLETAGDEGDTVMELYAADTLLQRDRYSGVGSFSKIRAYLTAGVYHVMVGENYHDHALDSYTMSATATPLAQLADAFEPDDLRVNAPTLAAGTEQARSLHHQTDVDWFAFDLDSPSRVRIETNWSYEEDGDVRTWLFQGDETTELQSRVGDLQRDLPAGRYVVAFAEDRADGVVESYDFQLNVEPLGDLIPVSGQLSGNATALALGQSIELSWTVENIGPGDTDPDNRGYSSWSDRIVLSEDREWGSDDYLGYRYRSEDPLESGGQQTRSTTIELPDDVDWAGKTAYILVNIDSSTNVPEVNDENNLLVIPVQFAAHVELTTASNWLGRGADVEFSYRALDAVHTGTAHIAIDVDGDPHNGSHTLVATNLPHTTPDADGSVTVSLANLPPRAEPYHVWLSYHNAKGVQKTAPEPIRIFDQVETAVDELGDAVGGNSYEVYQISASRADNSLQFRVATNYNPQKSSHTGNGQGGGDIRLHIDGADYAIAVNTHRAGASEVVAGRLYRGATYLGGTVVDEVPTFIDTYTEEVEGVSSIQYEAVEGQPWEYELVATIDMDAIEELDEGDEVSVAWAMYCGNDTDETTLTPEPQPEPESEFDYAASRLAWESDRTAINFRYQVVESVPDSAAIGRLYWSSSTSIEDAIGEPIDEQTLQTAVGEHGPLVVQLPENAMPGGATHLVYVIDQDEVLDESIESNNIVSMAIDGETLSGDELYEFLARQIAYTPDHWSTLLAATPDTPPAVSVMNPITETPILTGYVVDEVFSYGATGFAAVGMTSPNGAPILAVRGTDNWEGVYTDLDSRGVGYGQFASHRDEIFAWLNSVKSQGSPSIVGHSLGGAVSQLFAAHYTNLGNRLGDIYTFNSPGVSDVDAQLFKRQNVSHVMHYVNNGDIVSMAGDQFLTGLYRAVTFDNWFLLNKHTHPMLLEHSNLMDGEANVRHRAADIEIAPAAPTDWLNNPHYFHTDRDYITTLALLWALTKNRPDTDPLRQLPGWLLFRSTAEEKRQQIGAGLHLLRSVLSPNPQLDAILVRIPEIEIPLTTHYAMQATDLVAQWYTENGGTPEANPTLKIQGKVTLPQFYQITADFTGNNFVEFSEARGWEMKGRVSADDMSIPVVPGVATIKSAWFEFDDTTTTDPNAPELPTPPSQIQCGGHETVNAPAADSPTPNAASDNPPSGLREWRGGGTIETSLGVDLIVGLGFYEGEFNYVGVGVDDLGVPIFAGMYLQCMAGQVDHIADPKPASLTPQFGVTYGPRIRVDLPSWAGGTRDVALGEAHLQATLTRQNATGAGNFDFLEGLATGSGQVTLDWTQEYIQGQGELRILDEFIRMQANFRVDSQWNVGILGNATVRIPNIPYTPIKNLELGSAMGAMRFNDDGNYSNDYVAGWGVINTSFWSDPINVGVRLNFDGSWDWIGDVSDLDELPNATGDIAAVADDGEFPVPALSDSEPSLEKRYRIRDGAERLLLYAAWDDEAAVRYEVVSPEGTAYTEADLDQLANISIIDELSDNTTRAVGVTNPAAGVWTIRAFPDQPDVFVQLGGLGDAAMPEVAITDVSVNGQIANITYAAEDVDSDAEIQFFYDTDREVGGGVLINSLVERNGGGQVQWDLANVEPGDYHVYAVIDDRANVPVIAYAAEADAVNVPNPNAGPPFQNPHDRHDVDGSGEYTIADTFTLIDLVRVEGLASLGPLVGPRTPDDPYIDVDGDDSFTLVDIFDSIDRARQLIGGRDQVEAEGEAAILASFDADWLDDELLGIIARDAARARYRSSTR